MVLVKKKCRIIKILHHENYNYQLVWLVKKVKPKDVKALNPDQKIVSWLLINFCSNLKALINWIKENPNQSPKAENNKHDSF